MNYPELLVASLRQALSLWSGPVTSELLKRVGLLVTLDIFFQKKNTGENCRM